MPVPTSLGDLSTTASSNSPAGSESAKGTIDDYFRAHAKFIADLNAAKVAKAGDTMTGALVLSGNAAADLQAVTRQQLHAIYPVGSIYINATNSTNPGTLLGFGTWTAFGAGRVMVGFNAGDPLFDAAEETGGSKDAIVVSHTHTGSTNTTGDHSHTAGYTNGSSGSAGTGVPLSNFGSTGSTTFFTSSSGSHSHTFTTDSTGSSATNANLQPYITVYMWKRTA
jgi:hypothetical protein